MSLGPQIEEIRSQFLQELRSVSHSKEIENLKVRYLGKKGPVQNLMLELKNCAPQERPLFGKLINDLKEELSSHVDNTLFRMLDEEKNARLQTERIDITLPGEEDVLGTTHPVNQMMKKAVDILIGMGFSVQYGPNIDSDYYNFGALNFAPDHPAREMQDTFYITSDLLLRTHTSNVQVRAMEAYKPPIRVIAPGRCFRNETISARSHVFFHQIEGFYIDKHVSFSDLLSTMDTFWKTLLGENIRTRFRPSYFPFVEPGLEVDVACSACKGQGCRICKHTGWLEVCGAGMVHPEVLKSGGIDPEEYSGYAWGMGIERLAILHFGVDYIRRFTENDARFLKQFP